MNFTKHENFLAAPCDDCHLYEDCRRRLWACKQFFAYVHSGRFEYGERIPTRKVWQRIFIEDSDDTSEDTMAIKKFFKEIT